MNMYAYVHNDPVNKIDPMGLCGTGTRIKGRSSSGCRTNFSRGNTKAAMKKVNKLINKTQKVADNAKENIGKAADAIKPDSGSLSGAAGTGLGVSGETKVDSNGNNSETIGLGANSGMGVALTANWKLFSVGDNLVEKPSPVSSVHKVCAGGLLGACGTITILDNKDVGSFTLGVGLVYGGFMTNSVVINNNQPQGN